MSRKIKKEDIEKIMKSFETDFVKMLMKYLDKKFTEKAKTLNETYGISPAKQAIDELKKNRE